MSRSAAWFFIGWDASGALVTDGWLRWVLIACGVGTAAVTFGFGEGA